MNETTKFGLGIMTVGAILGLIADLLLRDAALGVGTLIGLMVLMGSTALLIRRYAIPISGEGQWLIIPAIFITAGFALRDSPTLVGLDILGLGATLLLRAGHLRVGKITEVGFLDYLKAIFIAGGNTLFSSAKLIGQDIAWADLQTDTSRSASGWAVLRGMLLALPALLLFGGLLSSADPIFGHYVSALFHWDFSSLCLHCFWTIVGAWLISGYLRYMLLSEKPQKADGVITSRFYAGSIEICTVLGILDALFFAFVMVQIRYLFGGRETVMATVGMTYAAYARHGFFELVTVAGLVLPLLLILHAIQRSESKQDESAFRVFAGILVLLLFAIMASALGRMYLYRSEYGLTELRVYTTAFMYWLAVVFVWFGATVLRGHRRYFAVGALSATFVAIVALHIFNPDAQIVQTNATLAHSGHRFDACYATSLSAAAVPALITELPALNPADQKVVATRLLQVWSPPKHEDWRGWCWDRWKAWRAVQRNQSRLRSLSGNIGRNPCEVQVTD